MSEKQDDIIELKYPETIRTRPGMYVGELDEASILLREVLDNSMDEVYNSESCNKILVYNLPNKVIVADSGRGIPIKKMPSEDVTMAYKSLYSIHAGSKFNKTNAGIGMNGVGTKCFPYTQRVRVIINDVEYDEQIGKLAELIKNNTIYTYSIDKNGNKIKTLVKSVILTKQTSELIKLDFGEFIILCTPDHKFLLNSGEYKEAKDLTEYDDIKTM